MWRTSVRPGKTKSDNLNLFYATISLFGCSQEEDENVVSHRVSMQTLPSAGGHFEFSNGANSNNTC
jgi:hypothetical protein